jgi:hypothetical protein
MLLLVFTTGCAPVVWRAPDRCLSCSAYDNPFGKGSLALAPGQNGEGGWWMRRYQWHLAYAGASLGIDYLARKLGVGETPAAVGTSLVLGLGPHLLQQQPRIDAADWIADLWIRSTPVAQRGGWRGSAIWTAGYAFLSSYANP